MRLKDGQAGGRVDHRVGGSHPVAHLLGKADDPDLLVLAETVFEPLADALVATGDADHQGVVARQRRLDRTLEVADSPAAAGNEHHPGVGGDVECLAGVAAGARHQELA